MSPTWYIVPPIVVILLFGTLVPFPLSRSSLFPLLSAPPEHCYRYHQFRRAQVSLSSRSVRGSIYQMARGKCELLGENILLKVGLFTKLNDEGSMSLAIFRSNALERRERGP